MVCKRKTKKKEKKWGQIGAPSSRKRQDWMEKVREQIGKKGKRRKKNRK